MLGTQYTLVGAGTQSGGTLTSAYAATYLATPGASLTIARVMMPVQPTDLRNQGRFLAETHETVFDRLTMLIQQAISGLSRALVRPFGKNYYDAQNRQIKNLGDPTQNQDATTKKWVNDFIANILQTGQGPINNAANVVLVGANGFIGSVQDIAVMNDAQRGAYMLAYLNQTIGKKLGEFVSPEDFGAVGDGVADDTAAVNAMLASGNTHCYMARTYRITDPLQDGSPVLVSNLPRRHIFGPGKITANTTVLRALGIYGADSIVTVNIDGNNSIACGVQCYAPRCRVELCDIYDLYTTTFSAVAIACSHNEGGYKVFGNRIRNLMSVGNGILGDGNGMSRAVLMAFTADVSERSVVESNQCVNTLGEEGDVLTVISTNGLGTYYRGDTTFRNNFVKNFTRRGMKSQAHGTRVIGNEFTHDMLAAALPNALTVIDFVQGGDAHALNNTLRNCIKFAQISCQTTTPDSISRLYVMGNIITGLGTETTQTAISLTTLGSLMRVCNNIIEVGTGRAISIGGNAGTLIDGNMIAAQDNASERVISIASAAGGAVVRGNILVSGLRQSFIGSDAPSVIVTGNHCLSDTVVFRQQSGNQNNVLTQNTTTGSQVVAGGGSTVTGNRLAGNFAIGSGGNASPDPLFVSSAGGPAVQLGALVVQQGQVVYNTAPTAGGYVGWIAMGSGAANAVTWKRFGLIEA